GWAAFQAGKLADAVTYYERALQAQPDLEAAHASLGAICARQGQGAKAITHWRAALALKEDDQATRVQLAGAYLDTSQFADAAREYQSLTRADPKDADSWNNLGFALEKSGKVPEAMDA